MWHVEPPNRWMCVDPACAVIWFSRDPDVQCWACDGPGIRTTLPFMTSQYTRVFEPSS